MLPPRGAGHFFLSENAHYLVCPHARICKLKNPFYNPCRFPIDCQLIMVVRRFAVSERRIGAAVKPRFRPRPNGRTDFPCLVPTIHMASVYALLSEFPSAHALTSAHLTRLTNLLSQSSKGRYCTHVMGSCKKLYRLSYAGKVSGIETHHKTHFFFIWWTFALKPYEMKQNR